MDGQAEAVGDAASDAARNAAGAAQATADARQMVRKSMRAACAPAGLTSSPYLPGVQLSLTSSPPSLATLLLS